MSSNYSSNRDSSSRGGRSRTSGGGRRRSSDSSYNSSKGHSSSHGEERPRREHTPSAPAKKQGFFSKILAVFGLGEAKSAAVKSNKPRSTSTREPRPDRPEGSFTRQSRKPERIEVTTPRVYVGNLSFDATESDLLELFSGIGSVQNVEIVANRETHRSKGFGFVQLSSVEEAKRAVTELHDKEYMGRKMVVSGAKAVAESRSERSERREASSEGTSESNEAAAA
jgi:RNA recognition motif-containing protein